MRGRKETVSSIKEGTRSKSRTVGRTDVKGSIKPSSKTSGHVVSGHGGVSSGSRKTTTGKGGSHK